MKEPRASVTRAQNGYTRHDAFSDFVERVRLPLLFTTLLALIGGSRFEATRPFEAMFLALALPLGALLAGALPLKEGATGLRVLGFGLAGLMLLLSELSIATTMFAGATALAGRTVALGVAMGAIALLSVFVEGVAARNGLRTRLAACMGIALVLALYLPAHFERKEALGTVLAGVLVAVFAGGGAGLVLGSAASSLGRR